MGKKNLSTIRERIAEVHAEMEPLRENRRNYEETAARLDRWVDNLASEMDATILIHSAASGDDNIHTEGMRTDRSPMCWLAWLDPDGLKARLRDELDQRAYEACSHLTAAERRKALDAKKADLAKLEAEEEQALTELEASGAVMPRRRDVNPAVVLNTQEVAEPEDDEEEEQEEVE